MLIEVPRLDRPRDHPPMLIHGNPVKLSGMAEGPTERFPTIGQHTDEVLGDELGLDAGELAGLRADGLIA